MSQLQRMVRFGPNLVSVFFLFIDINAMGVQRETAKDTKNNYAQGIHSASTVTVPRFCDVDGLIQPALGRCITRLTLNDAVGTNDAYV